MNVIGGNGNTALMFAARCGDTQIVEILIDCGAQVNAADEYGDTALMFAAQYGTMETVQRLIDDGANVNDVNKEGKNAPTLAKDPSIIKILENRMYDIGSSLLPSEVSLS